MNIILPGKILLSTLPKPTAYLDPGSGSFILQLILAMLLGWLLVLKSYWGKIVDWVKGLFSNQDEQVKDEKE